MLEERIGNGGFRLNSMMFGAWEKLTTDQKRACLTINNEYIIDDLLKSLKLVDKSDFQVDFMIDHDQSAFSVSHRQCKDPFFGNLGNGECEVVQFHCRNLTPCINMMELMHVFICSSSSIKGIFEDQNSNKMLFLDLVDYGLEDITRTIADLTETEWIKPLEAVPVRRPRVGSDQSAEARDGEVDTHATEEEAGRHAEGEETHMQDPIKKRRSVLEKDYKEYYIELKRLYHSQQVGEAPLVIVMKAVLTLIQNNVFYSICKLIKLLKFYSKLQLDDDARLLTNALAFKKFLLRDVLRKQDRVVQDSDLLISRERIMFEAYEEMSRRKAFFLAHGYAAALPSIYSQPFYINQQ